MDIPGTTKRMSCSVISCANTPICLFGDSHLRADLVPLCEDCYESWQKGIDMDVDPDACLVCKGSSRGQMQLCPKCESAVHVCCALIYWTIASATNNQKKTFK